MPPSDSPAQASDSPAQVPATPPRPAASPFWKGVLWVTAGVTLTLFLVPMVYVVKYYAVDRPRETKAAKAISPFSTPAQVPASVESLPWLEKKARSRAAQERLGAAQGIGKILLQPGINWKYPMECLSAKATLADLAAHDPDPAVKAAASTELGKVAQGGAIIRR